MLEGDTVAEKLDEPLMNDGKSCFRKHLITILVILAVIIIATVLLVYFLTKDDDDDDDEVKKHFTVLKTDKDIKKPNIKLNAEFQLVKSNNGMIGLLVNDPYAQNANILFRLENGYLMDSLDGISHFDEHLLLLGGSEKFGNYTSERKLTGIKDLQSSAYTDRAIQAYYYILNNNFKFEEVIDLMADTFRHPFYKKEVAEKEIQAVNHEFYAGIDTQYFLLEDMVRQLSSPKTPFHGFGCGTNETLKPSESDKLSKILKGFHNIVNRPENIFFVLYSNESIKDLENYVEKYLTYKMHEFPEDEIDKESRDKLIKVKEDLKKFEIFDDSLYGHGFYYNSDLKQNLLNIFFYIGKIDFKDLQFSLVEYISYLFNSQSLLNVLKKKNYISGMNEISAYSYAQLENNNVITVEFILTEEGLSNLQEVLLIIYKYTNLIREEGYKKKYFDDFIKYKNSQVINNFDKSEIGKSISYFVTIVNNYILYGEDQILTYGIPTEKNYDENKLKEYLSILSFEKSFFAMNTISNIYELETYLNDYKRQELNFYKVDFLLVEFPEDLKNKIKNDEEKIEGLSFRSTNPYFSDLKEKVTPCYEQETNKCKDLNEFDYKKENEYKGTKLEEENANFETYYQIDKSSESSIVNSYLQFKFTENENMNDEIIISILNFYFNHRISEINELKNVYDWEIDNSRISFKIRSFTDNTKMIIENIVKIMKEEANEIDFNYAKSSIKTGIIYDSAVSFKAYVYNLGNQLKNHGQSDNENINEIIAFIDSIPFNAFEGVYQTIVNSLYAFTFKIAGNIDKNLVQSIHDILKQNIPSNNVIIPPKRNLIEEKLKSTEPFVVNYYEKSKLPREVDNGLLIMYEVSEEYKEYMNVLSGCLMGISWVYFRFNNSNTYHPEIKFENNILYIYEQGDYKGVTEMEDDVNNVLLGMLDGSVQCENYADIVKSFKLKGNDKIEKTPTSLFEDFINKKNNENKINLKETILPNTFNEFMEKVSPIFREPKRYTVLVVRKDISDEYYNIMYESRSTNNTEYALNSSITITYTQDFDY